MELYLHIGQHKTGTTSIQQYIAKNRDYFLSNGYYIPITGQVPHLGHHHILMQDLGLNDGKELMAALKNEFANSKADKILISAEVVKNYIVENRYFKLFQIFRSLGLRKFKIIFYLRNPISLINSAYCEQIKSLAAAGEDIHGYVERYVSKKYQGHYRFFDYNRVLELAQKRDVEIILRPYSKAIAKSVVSDFLSTLNLPHERVFLEPRTNMSPGPIAIEVLRNVGSEIGPIEMPEKIKLIRKINGILGQFPEPTSYWGMDETVVTSAGVAKADRQTELLSQFAWKKPWRELIGDEPRLVNVFDPANATAEQIKIYKKMLDAMRKAIVNRAC